MRKVYELVGFEFDLVFDDDVVSRTRGTLKTLVCLQPEFIQDAPANTTVDDCAGLGVPGALAAVWVEVWRGESVTENVRRIWHDLPASACLVG